MICWPMSSVMFKLRFSTLGDSFSNILLKNEMDEGSSLSCPPLQVILHVVPGKDNNLCYQGVGFLFLITSSA